MVPQLAPDPLLQFLVRRLLVIFCEFQERTDDFAVVLVLQTDDDRAGNGGMRNETFFNFERIDVLAT